MTMEYNNKMEYINFSMCQDYSKHFSYINIFNIHRNLWWKCYFYQPHFIDEETEAKWNEETHPS